ncbi:hypothetical protein Syun_024131 [Stephania yunnanensis]|uniref:Bacterial Ig-like domain-containing protein n=1 Tax=Stephania yunnanensis TaxID=152371 RepID=A0AAP0I3T5_9MAGN
MSIFECLQPSSLWSWSRLAFYTQNSSARAQIFSSCGLLINVQYGRVVLVMDKHFCKDRAGNRFSRSNDSIFFVHFDRRSVFVDWRTHIPEKLLKLNSETRTVDATNNYKNLKLYLYFSQPVVNSSADILSSLNSSQGLVVPTNMKTNGDRRYGFLIKNLSSVDIVTLSFDSSSIISKYGTLVSPIAPVTFLYDIERPSVRLSTTSNMRTRDHIVPVVIKFVKPVFSFNSSTLTISGGHLQSFQEVSRSVYVVEIHADDEVISVHIPENITRDVAGNSNLGSNILQVRHYSVPIISTVLFTIVTAVFAITAFVAGLLTVSAASLESVGASPRTSSFATHPARNLFRIACHIQVFALSRWLAVTMPIEYYEFARGLQWSIPYLNLPWETGHTQTVMVDSSPITTYSGMTKPHEHEAYVRGRLGSVDSVMDASVFGLPLTPMEYRSFFEMQSHNIKPEAEFITESQNSNGWKHFDRNMFWLAVFCGGLMLLHALLLFILRCKGKDSQDQRHYRVLILPRFEIFLLILALPSICQASTVLLKGGSVAGMIVGIILLGGISFLLVALFLFLSIGITLGKLLQYKEVHQEGQKFHWYQEIVRVTLGPGKRGQWTWKNRSNSLYLLRFGPLFEDLRGPPKYMLSQIAGGNPSKRGDRIIASDDETEDAEAPFIQKLFGILRIYYTLLESVKRAALGIVTGAYVGNSSSRTPTLVLLCVTSFQLFFLVLKKPFIKKKVQLVEILSVAGEVGIFATCIVLLEKDFSTAEETAIGILMLVLFLVPFIAQMINEWYALYRLILRLDSNEKTFKLGLKRACVGLLLMVIPWNLLKSLDSKFLSNSLGIGDNEEGVATRDGYINSGSGSSSSADRPWLKQLREMAQASFSKDNGVPKDPSSSQGGISGFWRSKGSGSSSSSDFKSRSKSLYSDLEAIFSKK